MFPKNSLSQLSHVAGFDSMGPSERYITCVGNTRHVSGNLREKVKQAVREMNVQEMLLANFLHPACLEETGEGDAQERADVGNFCSSNGEQL